MPGPKPTAGGDRTLQVLSGVLALLPHRLRAAAKDPYTLTIEQLPLAASGTASPTAAIADDAAFLITHTTRYVTDAAGAALTPAFTVKLGDSSSGRSLNDKAVHVETMFGTAQQPFILAYPKLLQRNTTLQADLANLTATVQYVRLTFHGFKIFGFDR